MNSRFAPLSSRTDTLCVACNTFPKFMNKDYCKSCENDRIEYHRSISKEIVNYENIYGTVFSREDLFTLTNVDESTVKNASQDSEIIELDENDFIKDEKAVLTLDFDDESFTMIASKRDENAASKRAAAVERIHKMVRDLIDDETDNSPPAGYLGSNS